MFEVRLCNDETRLVDADFIETTVGESKIFTFFKEGIIKAIFPSYSTQYILRVEEPQAIGNFL